MARIRDYQTQESTAGAIGVRRVIPSDLSAGIGSDLGDALSGVAETMQKVAQRQELSDVEVKGYEKRAQWTTEFNKRATEADPGDTSFADKFLEDFNADTAALGNNLKTAAGRRAFNESRAKMASDFAVRAGQYQAELAGVQAKTNYLRGLDANRNTLIGDPTQFSDVLSETLKNLNDPTGPYSAMPPAARLQLETDTKKQLALSAVEGTINLSPELGKRQLTEGRWDEYLDADNKSQLLRQADTGIRAKEVETERARVAAERAQEKARQATADSFLPKIFDPDGPSLSTADILRSNLTPAQKEHYIGLVERVSKASTKLETSGPVMIDLYNRIHLPDGDPRKIVNEDDLDGYFGKGLNIESLRQLRDEMRGRRTSEGIIESDLKKGLVTTARSALTSTSDMLGSRDPRGDEQLQKFMSYFLPEYDRQRKAGKTPLELLSPDSPDYLGKSIDQFKRPWDEILRDRLPQIGAPRPAGTDYRNPADVAADFRAKKITKERAAEILREKGWAQ